MISTRLFRTLAEARSLIAPHVRESRWPHQIIPQNLKTEIISHYKDLSYMKQKDLHIKLSKNKNITIYTKPLLDQQKYKKEFLRSLNQKDIEDDSEKHELLKTSSMKMDLSTVDMLMYRSLPYLYSLSNRMFVEISVCDKDFRPFSMLDMGHNLGVSVWAAHDVFNECIDDFVIHEHNKAEYNRTVKLLNNKYHPHIENVRVKGAFSMPSSKSDKFDLVTAINYFPFLQENELHKWVDKVWNQTGEYLIIADISNRYTSFRMSKIRDYFIRKHKHEGHIIAPCPHARRCPLRKKNDANGCRFHAKNVLPMFAKHQMLPEEKQFLQMYAMDYSYLILKRGIKESVSKHARILRSPVHYRKGKSGTIEFSSCNKDGSLWNARATVKENLNLYRHIEGKHSGDLIDQNWWLEEFTPLPVGWDSRSVEQQIRQKKQQNQERFKKKGLDADTNLEHSAPDNKTLQFDGLSSSPSENLDWSDSDLYSDYDHIDSVSSIIRGDMQTNDP